MDLRFVLSLSLRKIGLSDLVQDSTWNQNDKEEVKNLQSLIFVFCTLSYLISASHKTTDLEHEISHSKHDRVVLLDTF